MMFDEVDYPAVQHAAQVLNERGAPPTLQSFEDIRDAAVRRKIHQSDIVTLTSSESVSSPIYICFDDDNIMEGFYIIDVARQRAWRWTNDDEGEVPCHMNPPPKTPAGLVKVCGTCQNSQGGRSTWTRVVCSIHPHDAELTAHFTCRAWTIRADLKPR